MVFEEKLLLNTVGKVLGLPPSSPGAPWPSRPPPAPGASRTPPPAWPGSPGSRSCRPDMVLLDYEMPVCDGRQTLEMLRSDPAFADLPVVFLTGRGDPDVVRKLELLVGQQVLLPQLLPAKGGHQLHHPAHKLPRRIPGGVEELEALKKVIVQLVFDMFQLESQAISSAYGGEKYSLWICRCVSSPS